MKRKKDKLVTLTFALIIAIALIIGFINLFSTMDARDDAEAVRQTKHIEQLEKEAATYKHYDLTDAEFVEETTTEPAPVMTPEEFEVAGVIEWNGWKYTYYSEYVLAGEGLHIPNRWSDGNFVRDGDGFLCVASNDLPYGSKVETPFGTAIVYDMVGDDVTGIIDIYVSFQ